MPKGLAPLFTSQGVFVEEGLTVLFIQSTHTALQACMSEGCLVAARSCISCTLAPRSLLDFKFSFLMNSM